MKKFVKERPVLFGVVAALVMWILFLLINFALLFSFGSTVSHSIGVSIDGALRIVFGILIIVLLGYIINSNGFKFTFSTEKFAKGMFAGIPILLLMIPYIIGFFDIADLNKDLIPEIPAVIFQKIGVGFFEEILFRGLLITAFLIKFGGTIKGRIIAVLISAIPFGLVHTLNIFVNGEGSILEGLAQGFIIVPIGMAFAAMYAYSKNLLSCMVMHTLFDIAVFGDDVVARYNSEALLQITNSAIPIIQFLVIPVLSIILVVKAKPFENYTELKNNALL